MRTLVIDIETVGEAWDDLSEVTQAALSGWISRSAKNAEEKSAQLSEVKSSLGFSPLTGSIVSIGLYDIERNQGAVYYVGEGEDIDDTDGNFILKQRSEVNLLKEFWEGAREYDTFVTFNGRSFDLPFILHRSVACCVHPTMELMKYRYLSHQSAPFHIDLLEEMTWYGAMNKRPSLHLFCRAYGISSPKDEGVDGGDIAELFQAKKFRDIARYNSRDVLATAKLYEKWRDYLAPNSFLQTVDYL